MKKLILAAMLVICTPHAEAQPPDVEVCIFGNTTSSIRSRIHIGIPSGTVVHPVSIFHPTGTLCVLPANFHGYVLKNATSPKQSYVVLDNGIYVYTATDQSFARR